MAGGVLATTLVRPWEDLFPYLLVAAASSFIYVAVADLLPQMQRRLPWRETASQLAWLAGGLSVVMSRCDCCTPTEGRPRPAGPGQRRLLDDQHRDAGVRQHLLRFAAQRMADSPRRPCEAITTKSQPCVLAWSRMASQGCSASTVCA